MLTTELRRPLAPGQQLLDHRLLERCAVPLTALISVKRKCR
jgi:hypothetical protein